MSVAIGGPAKFDQGSSADYSSMTHRSLANCKNDVQAVESVLPVLTHSSTVAELFSPGRSSSSSKARGLNSASAASTRHPTQGTQKTQIDADVL
eukprot:6464649-Amphidinium_carterae.3